MPVKFCAKPEGAARSRSLKQWSGINDIGLKQSAREILNSVFWQKPFKTA
ncbi:hypothetical protein MASR1M12_34690 [Erysipelotrichia bacterium]